MYACRVYVPRTVALNNTCQERLLWVIGDVGTQSVYCPTEMTIGTPRDAWFRHVGLQHLEDERDGSME
jgi:hypothetical protein